MPTDPVCGMTVEDVPGALRLQRENRTYLFCCTDCLRTFAAPEEARQRLLRRLAVAWPLAIATAVLTWGPSIAGGAYVAAGAAAIVQGYAGAGFYRGAWDAVRQRAGNMDLLIAAGTSAAFGYSVAVLLLPGRLPPTLYFDASALIVTVILTGNYLEALTRRRAGSAVRALGAMLPSVAAVVGHDGTVRSIARDRVQVGDRVRVAPGERFPCDGTVRDGAGSADESLLTGESAPVPKTVGSGVLAGSRNGDGVLVVEVARIGPDTFVAKVGELLEEAELARVPLQQRADRLAAGFAPFALGLATAAAILWLVVAPGDPTVALLAFVTVAVTACPCAFGLATPAAVLVGTGRAAEEGILFRGPDAIERAATVDTVLFDKTGTLTEATPELVSIVAFPPADERTVLSTAAGLEDGIDHPFARALLRAAAARQVSPESFPERRADPGVGIRGTAPGITSAVLRGEHVRERTGVPAALSAWAARAEERGESWSAVERDGIVLGAVGFRNGLAPGAREAVARLRGQGVQLALVTGDNEPAAAAVARELAITEVHANVSPAGKVARVRELQSRGRSVAFVGDGINDAAALAAADLGVAVGTGTEVAKEAGQLLLVRHDLRTVPEALALGRAVVGRVQRNLGWAVGYNAVLLPIAAGALVPVFGFGIYRVLPVLGAVAMGLSSTTVLLSSLSLRWANLSHAPQGVIFAESAT